ncbi:MAG: hypothetical protein O9256_02795 [Rhizobiaceae bacterium]|nr:hypothetical protein [Rhizobiaceae bacterium]MCZ8353009.1 hypothetical protein [Rhizobium sp.]
MFDHVAKKVEPPLRSEDLAMLERAHHAVCTFKRLDPNSAQASENAKLLINLFQSGIRNRHQLVAMLTGRKFP